jgi:NADH dehydrogenase (ubiquinone) 1 beta subcomplex subunit 3
MTEEWIPKATVGAVPKRVEKYQFSPIALPKTPEYAKRPEVTKLGDKLLKEVLTDTKIGLPDPWARLYTMRSHPFFSPMHRLKRAFPGLGIAIVAFGVFIGLEETGLISKHHEHA